MSTVAAVKESYFWSQVKTGLSSQDTHLCRIESTAGTGVFDVNGCHEGQEVWIELKVFHGQRLHFRSSQKSWGSTRSKVGGRIWILARKDDEMLLWHANLVFACEAKVDKEGKSFSILAKDLPPPIFSCKKPFKWQELKDILF
jgi:hypothetical protein